MNIYTYACICSFMNKNYIYFSDIDLKIRLKCMSRHQGQYTRKTVFQLTPDSTPTLFVSLSLHTFSIPPISTDILVSLRENKSKIKTSTKATITTKLQ